MELAGEIWIKYSGILVVAFIAIVGNGLLILTVARHRHLHTNTNAFIVCLATADFLFAFPTVPIYISAESAHGDIFGWPLFTYCLAAMALTGFQMLITMSTLFVLTFERYLSIVHPLKHRTWARKRNVVLIITLVWAYSALIGSLPLMGWNALQYRNISSETQTNTTRGNLREKCSALIVLTGPYIGILYVMHILPVCLILPISYTKMFIAVRQFVARKSSHNSLDGGGTLETSLAMEKREQVPDARLVLRQSKREKSLRLLLVVMIFAVFSWIPNMLWYLVATHGFTRMYLTVEMIENVPIPSWYFYAASTLGFTNSAVNPYIYGFGNVPIRKAFLAMITRKPATTRPLHPLGYSQINTRGTSSPLCKHYSPGSTVTRLEDDYTVDIHHL